MTKARLSGALLLAALAILPLLSSCVSVEEAPLGKNAVQKGQRTVLLIYPSPGPLVVEDESKGEVAAKLIPGISYAVQGAQDEHEVAASKDLQQYLPPFDAAGAFEEAALAELKKTPSEGAWTTAQEAGFSTAALRGLNVSTDVADWKRKYEGQAYEHETPVRDYSKMLELDDAVVFEVNLSYGLSADGEGSGTPDVSAVAKLYRANSMRQLWRHEEDLPDPDPLAKKLVYDYKRDPAELERRWKALLPQLAKNIAGAYARSILGLPEPSAAPAPASTIPPLFASTPTPAGYPAQPGQTVSMPGAAPTQPGYPAAPAPR